MRTSHLEIRRKIVDTAGKITDEELFASPSFGAYLADIAQGATKRYKRKIRLKPSYNTAPDAEIASTDNRTVFINTGNHISMSFPTRLLKSDSLIGFIAHECGHILYSDFRTMNEYSAAFLEGRYYPARPDDLAPAPMRARDELDAYLDEKDENVLKMINYLCHDLLNITEDAYVNARMCDTFPGNFRTGIRLNQVRQMEFVNSIQDMINEDYAPYSIVRNLIWQYCTCGDINNPEAYTGEYMDLLVESMIFVDDSKFDDDMRARCDAATKMLLVLWKYAKPMIEKAKKEGFDDTQEESTADFTKGAGSPTGRKTKPIKNNGFSPPSEDEDEAERGQIREVVDYETGRIALTKTDDIKDGTDGRVVKNDCYTGSGYENSGSDIERLLMSIAEDRTNEALEQELSEELQDEADKIRYGNAHKGVHVVVNRMKDVPDNLIREYDRVSKPLKLISKRLQKQVMSILRDERNGGKLSGLLMGKRFEARRIYQSDGRYFSNTRLPDDKTKIAVALLVDESGSMSGYDRTTTARAASITLHDFCNALGFPIMVMGHTSSWGDEVDLFSYVDFDSVDNKDRYRIMDMSSRDCNRDGAALRYVAERLLKREEQNKILILISDGQPAASGYGGTEAEADLRGIRQEYTRKGITMFAAAIGNDKDNIRRIYKEGFLDVTDLNQLPVNLTRLIQQYIKPA